MGVMTFDNLDITGIRSCTDVSGVTSPGIPATGTFWCETIAYTGTAYYSTSTAYVPWTTEVYINGARQGRSVHYWEDTPLSGVLRFNFTPTASDVVRVCYSVSASGA